MYLDADLFHINCATGMSCLMRKIVIDEGGGLKEFGQYLAEDYFLAQLFLDRLVYIPWYIMVHSNIHFVYLCT